MAIIYTYPQINSSSDLAASDLMIISDMSANGKPTKALTLKNLADFVTSTGTGTGTTNAIIKWTDGPGGLLGDSIMTENATQIDLAGSFLSTSSPTVTQAAPVSGIKSVLAATASAPHVALYGDSKHTGATQANSNYGVYAKGEFEGTGGFTSFIIGGNLEARYDGSGSNGANASMYGAYNLARATSVANGTVSYMIGANTQAKVQSANVTATNLQGQHTTVELTNGTAGDLIVNLLDFDGTGGTVTNDFSYLQIQNDTMPTVNGTARAINSKSVLPSLFQGQVEIPLIPTGNSSAASKQYVDQQIASIPAGLVFQGNWNANTNTPALASGTGTVGNYYVVSVAGNTNLDGITDWEVGDWAVFVEVGGVDKWDKIDQTFVQGAGATGQVSFWNGVNSVTGDNDLYWDNANKRLGIGTTSPGEPLEVHGNIKARFAANGAIGQIKLGNLSNIYADNGDLQIRNNVTGLVKVTSVGNVGIGNISPSYKLEVNAGTDNQSALFESTDVTNTIGIKDSATTLSTSTGIGVVGDDLFLYAGGTAYNQRLRVQGSTGNVGIGTSNPGEKLDVAGDNPIIKISDSNNTIRYAALNISTNGGSWFFSSGDSNSGAGVANSDLWITRNKTGTDNRFRFHRDSYAFSVYSGSNQNVQLNADGNTFFNGGNVGIGTTSPDSLLEISSGTTTDFLKLTSTGSNASPAKIIFEKSATEQGIVEYVRNGDLRIYNTDGDGGVLIDGSSASGNDLYVSNNGKVGIGTTSPSRLLQVKDTSGIASIAITSANTGTAQLELGGTSDNDIAGISYNSSTQKLFLKTNNTGQLYVDNSGNVGIGTSSPSTTLEIGTSGVIDTDFQMQSDQAGKYFKIVSAGNFTELKSVGDQNLFLNSSGSGGYVSFLAGNSERMRINYNGKVGIGTTSPDKKLDVTVDTSDDGVILQTVSGRKSLEMLVDNGTNGQGKIHFYTGANLLYGRIMADTNGLNITQLTADKDISFQADDGSGGITEYFRLDGSLTINRFYKNTRLDDSVQLQVGTSADLQILHNGTDSFIDNYTGNLTIRNRTDDGDIVFTCDDGSGGLAEYFRVDGGTERNIFSKDSEHGDNISAYFGSGNNMRILYNGSHGFISQNVGGDLRIVQNVDDGDIKFEADDGSGGVTTYFKLDGGNVNVSVAKDFLFQDNVKAKFGNSSDLQIYHDGTDSRIYNNAGDFVIRNQQDDGDIKFQSDDGSGGAATYFFLDGSNAFTQVLKDFYFLDNVKARFGDSGDFTIHHNTNTFLKNVTNNLIIENTVDDANIQFKCDDGSGGTTEYFRVDGSTTTVAFSQTITQIDNKYIGLGNSFDFHLQHNGTNSVITNSTGNLEIRQNANIADIIFYADGGSGSAVEYMRLDGSQVSIRMKRQVKWDDNIKATFGDSDDLEIYHDGTDSYVSDTGTGDLIIQGSNDIWIKEGTNNLARFNGQGLKFYYANVSKLETISSGAKLPGPGDGITLVSPDGNTTRKISIDNSGNLVVA